MPRAVLPEVPVRRNLQHLPPLIQEAYPESLPEQSLPLQSASGEILPDHLSPLQVSEPFQPPLLQR